MTYDTAVIGQGDIETSVSAAGKFRPRRFLDVGAQVSGQILRLHVQAGDVLGKGQLRVEIDLAVQKATVDVGRASLTGLRAQLAEQQRSICWPASQPPAATRCRWRHACRGP